MECPACQHENLVPPGSARFFVLLLPLLGVVSCLHTLYSMSIEVIPAEAAVAARKLAPAEVERAMALFASFAKDEGFRLEESIREQRGHRRGRESHLRDGPGLVSARVLRPRWRRLTGRAAAR